MRSLSIVKIKVSSLRDGAWGSSEFTVRNTGTSLKYLCPIYRTLHIKDDISDTESPNLLPLFAHHGCRVLVQVQQNRRNWICLFLSDFVISKVTAFECNYKGKNLLTLKHLIGSPQFHPGRSATHRYKFEVPPSPEAAEYKVAPSRNNCRWSGAVASDPESSIP